MVPITSPLRLHITPAEGTLTALPSAVAPLTAPGNNLSAVRPPHFWAAKPLTVFIPVDACPDDDVSATRGGATGRTYMLWSNGCRSGDDIRCREDNDREAISGSSLPSEDVVLGHIVSVLDDPGEPERLPPALRSGVTVPEWGDKGYSSRFEERRCIPGICD